jgi:hypothetical protein
MRTNTGGSRLQKLLDQVRARRQAWIMTYRVVTTVLLVVLTAISVILLTRPAPTAAPSAAEITRSVNGPVKFERPSAMEYVAQTNSCVVGGTVTSTEWHVGNKTVDVGDVDGSTVDYTAFGFQSDEGRVFTVSDNGALYTNPGENLGLELYCDAATMNTAPTFGLVAINYGGK